MLHTIGIMAQKVCVLWFAWNERIDQEACGD